MKNNNIFDINSLVKIRVEQLHNKNQFVIYYKNENEEIIVFQSYKTIIAIYYPVKRIMYINYHYWDYSLTTSKHLKLFINTFTPFNYEGRLDWLKTMEKDQNLKWFEDND